MTSEEGFVWKEQDRGTFEDRVTRLSPARSWVDNFRTGWVWDQDRENDAKR
jgi:hypothetical protein